MPLRPLTDGELHRLADLTARGHHRAARAAAMWQKAQDAKPMSATRRHFTQAAIRLGRQAIRDARRDREGGPRRESAGA